MNTAQAYSQYLIGNYAAPLCTIERAQGAYVYTADGRRLLDFGSGIAVSAIGHCHPKWTQAIAQTAAKLGHLSNLYAHAGQAELAQKLVAKAGGSGKVLFCNSGTEANEALLKLARLHGRKQNNGKEGVRYKVICAQNAFHGRTFGAMAATPQEKIQGGFRPMLEGFAFGKLNDIGSFAAQMDERTAAVMLETIQGESGITACDTGFLRELRALCSERGVLLMLDEVQCGIGRTGDFFAFERSGVMPDAIGMAKGLGGGFPIGAIWVAEAYAPLFTPGSHGTTFGGGPLACAAALATLDVLEEEHLLAAVQSNSARWIKELEALAAEFPQVVLQVKGRGYMLGLALAEGVDTRALMTACYEQGLLAVPAGGNTLRLLPPLNVTAEELAEATAILRRALVKITGSA